MTDAAPFEGRPITADEPSIDAALEGLPLEMLYREPYAVAQLFLAALEDPAGNAETLAQLVTPESAEVWDGFRDVVQALEYLEPWGVGSLPREAPGAPDVRYAKIIPNVSQGMRVDGDQSTVALFLTLVWRPEYGRWMVAWFGALGPLELLPRSSPGVGPR